MIHQPVLLREVIEYLDPKPGENFVDCTIGGGGHTAAILERNKPNGRVLGIEIDLELYKKLQAAETKNQKPKTKNRLILVCDSFVNLKKIVEEYNFKPVNGILLDLGLSSWHLEESGRGFTFRKNEPLIMRYGSPHKSERLSPTFVGTPENLTAGQIVNNWPEEELVRIFRDYGQERFARTIAYRIVRERAIKPIKTTFELVALIKRSVPPKYRYGRIHFATRIFQALRIAVNSELENLEKVLPQAMEILEKEDRLVVISFHSLEDRIVKNFLRAQAKEERLKILTKKPVTPSETEVFKNPRSRSAKLRAALIT